MEEEEQKLEDVLPLAHGIRYVVDELIRQMSLLPGEERVPGSPRLLTIFDQLSAVISEKTIVEAANFADEGSVKLHMSDPTVSEPTGSCILGGEEQAVSQASDLEDDFQIPLNVIQSQVSSLRHHLTSTKLSSQQSSTLDSCVKLFGAVSQKSDLLEQPSSELSGTERRIYEVYCGSKQDLTFYILPNINYCACDHFQTRVDFTCAHVLATWLSHALDTVMVVQSPYDLLDKLFSNIVDKIE